MNERKPPAALSLWLTPCSSDAAVWQQLIDALAKEHNGPRFAAHVTAATIGLEQREAQHLVSDAINWLEAVAGDFEPQTLTVSPPTTGESFFQCVLCELPTAPVTKIGQSFLALAGNSEMPIASERTQTKVTQQAHISLLYSSMNPDQRASVAETIAWPVGPLTLDTLKLVGPGQGQTDFSNPQKWEVLGTAKLVGDPLSG